MKGRSLNREEKERAEALNENIAELKALYDDGLYGLRSYFDKSHALLKYLELKTDYAYNEDCFYFYLRFIQRLKELTKEMQFYVMEAQRAETHLHRFSMQYNRLLKHLEEAGRASERAGIFLEMEMETNSMLAQVINLREVIVKVTIDFQHLKKKAEIIEAN
jgi:hypothetical protein